jgi:hypothetical protein
MAGVRVCSLYCVCSLYGLSIEDAYFHLPKMVLNDHFLAGGRGATVGIEERLLECVQA